jgi:hypothetical protein
MIIFSLTSILITNKTRSSIEIDRKSFISGWVGHPGAFVAAL